MVGSAVPLAQIQNCEKRSAFEQSETALHQNIAQKGAHAYYFAHNRHFEIPEDCKIISGPGLVTGGPPERIEAEESAPIATVEERTIWVKDYSWADASSKVKIYIPCDGLSEDTATN